MNPSVIKIMIVVSSAVGLLFAIITCALPNWIVLYQSTTQYMEVGLWKLCVHGTDLMICKTYSEFSDLLTADLKAGRGLTIISILLSILALLIVFACSNFTNFITNEDLKPKVRMGAEIALLVAGLFLLIPVIWSSSNFSRALIANIRIEKGACIHTGWLGAISLMLAGSLLFWNRRNP